MPQDIQVMTCESWALRVVVSLFNQVSATLIVLCNEEDAYMSHTLMQYTVASSALVEINLKAHSAVGHLLTTMKSWKLIDPSESPEGHILNYYSTAAG